MRTAMCRTSCASQHATHNCTDEGNPSWRLFSGRLLGFHHLDASLSQLLTRLLRLLRLASDSLQSQKCHCTRPPCLKNAVQFSTVNYAHAVRFQIYIAILHIRVQLSLCRSCSKIATNFSAAVEMQVTGTMPSRSHAKRCPA